MRRDKRRRRRIARERIRRLLELADQVVSEDLELAERYGELARRISMRCRVRIPRAWKWRYCRYCKKLLFPGITARIRTRSDGTPRIVMTCLRCGGVNRRPILREKRSRLSAARASGAGGKL